MKLSKKGEYALRSMIGLGVAAEVDPLPVRGDPLEIVEQCSLEGSACVIGGNRELAGRHLS